VNRDYEWWFEEGKEGGKKGSSSSRGVKVSNGRERWVGGREGGKRASIGNCEVGETPLGNTL